MNYLNNYCPGGSPGVLQVFIKKSLEASFKESYFLVVMSKVRWQQEL